MRFDDCFSGRALTRPPLVLLFMAAALFAVGCDCSGPTGTPCASDVDCPSDQRCTDGLCAAVSPTEDGGADCADGGARCGAVCCGAGMACNAGVCGPDCGAAPICGSVCCDIGMVCNAGACMADCGAAPICGGECCGDDEECLADACVVECADEALRCGDVCCGGAQACLGSACVDLGEPCTFTEQCEVDDFCEPTLMRCVPRDAIEVCEFRPPVGELAPVVGCQWRPPAGASSTFLDVVMTPAVMNMTDDNADGVTDTLDTPDIVFIAFDYAASGCCTANGRLVVASGACNADGSMTTHAIIESPFVDNSSGVALGNLHPDTMPDERAPEIVATFRNGGTIAFTRTADDGSAWTELWRSPLPSVDQLRSGGTPSLADVDADGQPEVIVGNVVLNGLDGALVWNGRVTVGASAGVGNNAFLGPSSTVADLDLDGQMEVIAGNTVYEGASGAERWTFAYGSAASSCGGAIPCDGFNGVGDFDADPEGEVVIVRRGEVFVLQHEDGAVLHRVTIPKDDVLPYLGNGPCTANEAGPPTIADFDGDGRPEIGTAGADFYVVVDFDCVGDPLPAGCARENILWMVPNQDCSSRATGSSVFDFEGDGAAEVVYADEQSFRIFDGRTGAILFEDTSHSSNTRIEMPIVVDVDNDGKSEIIIPEPNIGDRARSGVEVWQDADNNWVRTRRVWNQHAYHVTNITEDGQVPRVEEPNWRNGRLNNFRQNVQPGGLFDAPDLTVTNIEVGECVGGTLRVAVTVENRGALGVPPGIAVWGRVRRPGGEVIDLGVEHTTTTLLPGGSEILVFTWDAGTFTDPTVTFEAIVDDDGTGGGAYNECDETNNGLVSGPLMTCAFG